MAPFSVDWIGVQDDPPSLDRLFEASLYQQQTQSGWGYFQSVVTPSENATRGATILAEGSQSGIARSHDSPRKSTPYGGSVITASTLPAPTSAGPLGSHQIQRHPVALVSRSVIRASIVKTFRQERQRECYQPCQPFAPPRRFGLMWAGSVADSNRRLSALPGMCIPPDSSLDLGQIPSHLYHTSAHCQRDAAILGPSSHRHPLAYL